MQALHVLHRPMNGLPQRALAEASRAAAGAPIRIQDCADCMQLVTAAQMHLDGHGKMHACTAPTIPEIESML